MKLFFLGSGAAFDTNYHHNYHSNMLLCADSGKNFLIDCGSDARFSLNELGLSYKDIDAVYISHVHADHVGGLEWLSLSTFFDPACKKPSLFISTELAHPLWEHTLLGGLTTLKEQVAALETYFDVHSIAEGTQFKWQNVEAKLVQTIHIIANGTVLPTHGLFLTIGQLSVFITTDTIFAPELHAEYYEKADIIFHDCETAAKASTVHTRYEELVTLPVHIRNKIWLYHYNDGVLPNAHHDGFRGFVQKGQCFDFNNPESLFGKM